MIQADLLSYKDQLKTHQKDGVVYVLDPIRKKHIVLQPEEMVRQLMIAFLTQEIGISTGRIQVEKQFKLNKFNKRFDILCYDSQMEPALLVECKAFDVKINAEVFDQASRYNIALKAPYLLVSNGQETHCAHIDFNNKKYTFIDKIPIAEITN